MPVRPPSSPYRLKLVFQFPLPVVVPSKIPGRDVDGCWYNAGMEEHILELLNLKGPLTGSEIMDALDARGIELWRACVGSSLFTIRRVGRRYLRLDRRVEGFARLSPSILREFLTYSVVAPRDATDALEERAREISHHIDTVTQEKSSLAYRVISALVSRSENPDLIMERTCFILAGDIVYDMAHDVPRPERSTGRLVRGSDMDLVVIADDSFPEEQKKRLDERIYREKHNLLVTPHLREEIDYVVKDLDRVREQLRFDTFRCMVACKIMEEGTLLYGSEALFTRIKGMLQESGVTPRLQKMEQEASMFRRQAETTLLTEEIDTIRRNHLDLFYPTEESEEFE